MTINREDIHKVCFSCIEFGFDDQCVYCRDIEAMIKRAVRKERARCVKIVTNLAEEHEARFHEESAREDESGGHFASLAATSALALYEARVAMKEE